jgi:hypothetical protein
MSIHIWVRRNLAAYIAGGLDATERARLERHVSRCTECARVLEEARSRDSALAALFAEGHPGLALENDMIHRLRQTLPLSAWPRLSRKVWALVAVAAAVLLAASGAGLSALLEENRLQFPGERANALAEARNQLRGLKQLALSTHSEHDSFKTHGTTSHGPNFGFPDDGISNNIQLQTEEKRKSRSSVYLPPPDEHGGQGKFSQATDYRVYLGYFKPADFSAAVLSKSAQTPRGEKGNGDTGKKKEGEGKSREGRDGRDGDTSKKPVQGLPRGNQGTDNKQPEPAKDPPPGGRKVIRSGEIEFEVDSFDAATTVITRLVAATKGGFVATVNSEKLANGKVRGSVVVRVPPEHLDALVLALRKDLGKIGELKGQRIGSQDITKQYTDLESRLKAAKTMEQRLLTIIRDAKGQIKDLLQAEKELGVWRTRVEELEGELRYYANLVSLSTLTIVLTEKDIRTAAGVIERERVQAGVEVEDVETAMRKLLKAVADDKGRVTRSELKQFSAGQFNALMEFEVAPEKAGPVRDRLRQLGTVVRLEIDRVQQAENGGTLPKDGKLVRGDTQFKLSLYNLANVGPRETITLKLAAADVPAAYRALREAVAQAKGREVNAQLNEQDRLNVTAQLDFNVPRAAEKSVQAALSQFGEVLSRGVTRKAEKENDKDRENLTDAKLGFNVELLSTARIPPREIITLEVVVADVRAAQAVLDAQVKEAGGTVIAPQTTREPSGRVIAHVTYRVPLAAASGVAAKVKAAGEVRVEKEVPDPKAPEGKLAVAILNVTLSNAEVLVPTEQGLWAQVRHGLSVSLRGLSLSASWLIVGLLFVLPWILLVWAAVWLVRRLLRGSPAPAAAPARADTPATGA